MHTDTVTASEWWARPRDGQGGVWIQNYQKSLGVRHRELLAAIVRELQVETLLEIGCHCGPNLVKLAEANPQLHAQGIDVNADAIAAGQRWLQHCGLSKRVKLSQHRFPDGTAALPSGGFDVVLSCYTLAYVAPADLDASLYEMGRLAARAVILAEPMALNGRVTAPMHNITGYREWAHDYRAALPWIGTLSGAETRLALVAPPVDRLNGILVVERESAVTSISSGR